MVWQVVWHDPRLSDARAQIMCPLRKHRILPVMIAFEGDVVIILESERQRWTETVGVDDSLSRDIVTTAVSVLTDREWLAHAAPPRARPRGVPATRTPKKASRVF